MKEDLILTSREQKIYKAGVKEGIKRYAWWRDGAEYVGTSGRTLQMALQDVDAEPNPLALLLEVPITEEREREIK